MHHDIADQVWVEPKIVPDSDGFPLLHPYLEQVWLPLVGPSAVLALRSLARQAGTEHHSFLLDCGELAAQLGLGSGLGRHSHLKRTLNRLIRFRFLTSPDPVVLELSTLVPAVHHRKVAELPDAAQYAHRLMTAATTEVTR